jgi:hypothetical protein
MQPSSQIEDTHAEVRAIIEGGFAKLQAWLDMRLQSQEELLHKISTAREFPSSTKIESGWPVKDITGLQVDRTPSPPVAAWAAAKAKKLPDQSVKAESAEVLLCDVETEDLLLPGCLAPPIPPRSGDDASRSHPDAKQSEVEQLPDRNPGQDQFVRVSSVELLQAQDEVDWQDRLMQVFAELDQDKSGSVDEAELVEAFEAVGLPQVKCFDVLRTMDKTGNGSIDHLEWFRIIDEASKGSDEEVEEVVEFLRRLEERQRTLGHVLQHGHKRKSAHPQT